MSQNPYEIRLSLLGMAKELLEQEYHQKVSIADQQFGFEMDKASRNNTDLPARDNIPFPTEQEIIDKAKTLNDFVSNG